MYRQCVRPSWRVAGHIGEFSSSPKLVSTLYEQRSSITTDYGATSSVREFARRHIGPNDSQTTAMLEYLELQVTLSLFTRHTVDTGRIEHF